MERGAVCFEARTSYSVMLVTDTSAIREVK
jgi:hypothetical protein